MTLAALIAEQKTRSFTDPSTAADEDALGILISNHFRWDGGAIIATFAEALEDANFHAEAEAARGWTI